MRKKTLKVVSTHFLPFVVVIVVVVVVVVVGGTVARRGGLHSS